MSQDHVIRQVLHDRGGDDDHWARVFGALCRRCGQLIEETDFARRRADDDWVHEQCPPPLHVVQRERGPAVD